MARGDFREGPGATTRTTTQGMQPPFGATAFACLLGSIDTQPRDFGPPEAPRFHARPRFFPESTSQSTTHEETDPKPGDQSLTFSHQLNGGFHIEHNQNIEEVAGIRTELFNPFRLCTSEPVRKRQRMVAQGFHRNAGRNPPSGVGNNHPD